MRSDDRMAENIITRVNEADEALKMRRKAVIKTAGGAFAFALAFAFVFSFPMDIPPFLNMIGNVSNITLFYQKRQKNTTEIMILLG